MSIETAILDSALVAAVGNDPALHAELRAAFIHGARAHVDAMAHAKDDIAWHAAAWRLHGLAASFGAIVLMESAADAASAGRPDPEALRRVHAALVQIAG